MVVGTRRPCPRDRRSIPRPRSPLNTHTHTYIKKAIFLIILLSALAWLSLVASDGTGAEMPAQPTQATITTTSTTLPPTTTSTIPPTTTTSINRTEVSVIGNSPPLSASCAELETALVNAGGTPHETAFAMPIARRESGPNCNLGAVNQNSSTGDNSWGPWQINYYDELAPSRIALIGLPETNIESYDRAAQNFLLFMRTNGECHWRAPNYCAG